MRILREQYVDDPELGPVRLVRRRRQKNLRVRVKEGRVMVSGPYHASMATLKSFLEKYRSWACGKLRAYREEQQRLDQIHREHKDQMLLRGVWMPITVAGDGATAGGRSGSGTPKPGACQPELFGDLTPGADPEAGANWLKVTRAGSDGAARWLGELDRRLVYYDPQGQTHLPGQEERRAFCRELARRELPRRVEHAAGVHGFSYNRVYIRGQKTKWGSCSARGNVSLNWRLIKCPPWIQDYLAIHELCHTVHMNHSRAFWELVHRCFPHAREADRWLRAHGPVVYTE